MMIAVNARLMGSGPFRIVRSMTAGPGSITTAAITDAPLGRQNGEWVEFVASKS